MSKSIWYIFIFGTLGVFILLMAMCISMDALNVTGAANRVKLAEAVRAQFKFESASAGVAQDGVHTVLRVKYQSPPSKITFDLSAQNKEMEAVAEFSAANYTGTDKRQITEIRITRTEVRGSGCWQRTEVSHLSKPDPFRPAGPFPLRR